MGKGTVKATVVQQAPKYNVRYKLMPSPWGVLLNGPTLQDYSFHNGHLIDTEAL